MLVNRQIPANLTEDEWTSAVRFPPVWVFEIVLDFGIRYSSLRHCPQRSNPLNSSPMPNANEPLRLQFIVCQVLQREAYYCASRTRNIVDVVLMPQGLHQTPDKLRAEVQKALDRSEDGAGKTYDATLLGYGLCSNGIVGLTSKIPVVVARGHDCMTLLLGSRTRYKDYFESHRGTYWYSPGWIEHGHQPGLYQ
jgi:hypothetical protein